MYQVKAGQHRPNFHEQAVPRCLHLPNSSFHLMSGSVSALLNIYVDSSTGQSPFGQCLLGTLWSTVNQLVLIVCVAFSVKLFHELSDDSKPLVLATVTKCSTLCNQMSFLKLPILSLSCSAWAKFVLFDLDNVLRCRWFEIRVVANKSSSV